MPGRLGLLIGVLLGLAVTGCVTNDVAPTPVPQPLAAPQLPAGTTAVLEAGGDGHQDKVLTRQFAVGTSWLIAYATDCSSQSLGSFYTQIKGPTERDKTPPSESWPHSAQRSGRGTQRYRVAGTFSLTVTTPCQWRLSVATCTPDCGHESTQAGTVELSGFDGLSSALVPLAAEMEVAYQVDCSDHGGGGVRFDSFEVGIPYGTDPSVLNTQVSFSGLADAGRSFFHNLRPRNDLVVVRASCPWKIRLGPRGHVSGFPNPAPPPPLHLQPGAATSHVLTSASGMGGLATDSFAAVGGVDIAWGYQCDTYADLRNFSATMLPADAGSPPVKEVFVISQAKKQSGSGVTHVAANGLYYLSTLVSSSCVWALEVRH